MKSPIAKRSAYLLAGALLLPMAAAWGATVTAARVSGSVQVAPNDAKWNSATAVNITLMFVDSVEGGMGGGGGSNTSMTVKAIHNGTNIAFRLTWTDNTQNNVIDGVEDFTDAAGIMHNANMICNMGSQSNPVNIWYWRAVDNTVQNLLSGGLGTVTHTVGDDNIVALNTWTGTQWQVVLSRSLTAIDPNDQVSFKPGSTYNVAFARWNGANKERNGRKYRSGMNSLKLNP